MWDLTSAARLLNKIILSIHYCISSQLLDTILDEEKSMTRKTDCISSSISRCIDTQWDAHFSPLRSKLGSTRWVLGDDRVAQKTAVCLSVPRRKARMMRCRLQAGVLKSILMMKMTTRGAKIFQSLRQDGQSLRMFFYVCFKRNIYDDILTS